MPRSNHQRLIGRRSDQHRSGFTLLEMMLVLGVMAVFASMTMPSALRMFRQQKLTGSAERVRAAIALCRVHAIESGLIYQFCCEVNGVHYVVVPFEPDHVMTQTGNQSGGGPVAHRGSGFLPKGIVFSSEHVANAGSALAGSSVLAGMGSLSLSMQALDGLPNSGDLAGLNWSTPILFKPDGSASADTVITVSDTHSQHIRLRVRALTGAVSMEQLHVEKRR